MKNRIYFKINMKNYFYYSDDEESFSEEEEYEEENIKFTKKKEVKKEVKKEGFDEDYFDFKVAKSMTNIHRKRDDFSNWVEENLKHLVKLYKLSNLTCSEELFYTCIYENSLKRK